MYMHFFSFLFSNKFATRHDVSSRFRPETYIDNPAKYAKKYIMQKKIIMYDIPFYRGIYMGNIIMQRK